MRRALGVLQEKWGCEPSQVVSDLQPPTWSRESLELLARLSRRCTREVDIALLREALDDRTAHWKPPRLRNRFISRKDIQNAIKRVSQTELHDEHEDQDDRQHEEDDDASQYGEEDASQYAEEEDDSQYAEEQDDKHAPENSHQHTSHSSELEIADSNINETTDSEDDIEIFGPRQISVGKPLPPL